MKEFLKSTLWQGSVFASIVLLVLFTLNYRLVIGLLNINKKEDFSYQESYFFVYRGVFQDSPKIAILFWGMLAIIALIRAC